MFVYVSVNDKDVNTIKMIQDTNLSKIFRTEEIETTALNGVSFEIKDGEFVAVMGPSGCGKSTLLNIPGLLKELPAEGSTIVMVTHSQKDAACAQRTIDLFNGQIVSDVKNEL